MIADPLILHIESSSLNCSVALSEGSRLISCKEEISDKYIHAERLHVLIDALLKECGHMPSDLHAIAVDGGPGSYTGLRIGFSAAKGLAYALNIPLISISSMEVLYGQHIDHPATEYVVPMLDARRMEVFASIYREGNLIEGPTAMILEENSFEAELEKHQILFLGDSNEKAKNAIRSTNAIFPENAYPSARHMVEPVMDKFRRADFEDVAYSEPFYLKDFLPGKPKV